MRFFDNREIEFDEDDLKYLLDEAVDELYNYALKYKEIILPEALSRKESEKSLPAEF